MVLSHASPEESLTAVTTGGPVVFPRGPVPAYSAVLAESLRWRGRGGYCLYGGGADAL